MHWVSFNKRPLLLWILRIKFEQSNTDKFDQQQLNSTVEQCSLTELFLCLVIAVGAQRDHRVTCYLDVLTHRTREGLCTHIIVPSAWTDDGLNLQSLSEDDYDALGKMKERNSVLKVLLGLEVKVSRLELMFTNETNVENLIHALLTNLKEKHFDGVDLTLVNDLISDKSSESTELLTNLLKSLREAFEEETDEQTLIVSVSLSDRSDNSSAVEYDLRTLAQYVDFISILPAHLEKDGPYINSTVEHWLDQQVDLLKLNLVIPAFLPRSHKRHHHKHRPSNNDANTEESKKYHIHGVSLNMANQVCQAIKSGEQFITLTRLSDEQSLLEVSWLLQKGFGGVGVVFIDIDVFCNSVCDGMTQDEKMIVESKLIVHSHHRRRVHGHHHEHEHRHNHRDRHQHLHFLNERNHHHRHQHHHHQGHHGHHEDDHHHLHHHHHPRPAP